MLLKGWAGQGRLAANGDHQLLSLILPGDIVQTANEHYPFRALTDVTVADLPAVPSHSALNAALDWSRQLDLEYLYNQVSRIGGMGAGERLLDVIREIYERLLLSDSIDGSSFNLPLSQVVIGDLLSITPIHTNRMIREARTSGELSWEKKRVTIPKRGRLDQQARKNLFALAQAVGIARNS